MSTHLAILEVKLPCAVLCLTFVATLLCGTFYRVLTLYLAMAKIVVRQVDAMFLEGRLNKACRRGSFKIFCGGWGGGVSKAKTLKGKYETKIKFQVGWGFILEGPWLGSMDIFGNTIKFFLE